MRSLSIIMIVLILSGCSGNSNDSTESSVAPSKSEAAAKRNEGQSGNAFVLPDFDSQDPLAPEQWEIAIGSVIPLPADSVVADRNDSVLSFHTKVNSGRAGFDYRKPINGDFVVTAEVSVTSQRSRPAHDRKLATNAWFQVHAADKRTHNLAAPVYQGGNTPAQLQVLRHGDQVICLCDGQQRGRRRLSGPLQFGLWMHGDGQLNIHSFKLEHITPDLAMFPSRGTSNGTVTPPPHGFAGPPPGFAGGPPGFGGPSPGTQGGFGDTPPGAGFGGGAGNASVPDQPSFGSRGPILQFRDWEIPGAMIPEPYQHQVVASILCNYDSTTDTIRFDRNQGGPPFALQHSQRMVGDFTADFRLVVVGDYARRRGEVGVAVVPEDLTTPLKMNSLPQKDGAGQREYLLRFTRSGNKLITQVDHKTVMEQELAAPALLQLLVAGEVEFSINALEFNRDAHGEVAVRVEPASDPSPETRTADDLVTGGMVGEPVKTYPLPAPVDNVVVGGEGKYLLLHFPKISKLGLFDVELGEVTRTITLRGKPMIAASAEHAIIVSETNGMIARLRLSDLTIEGRSQLPREFKTIDIAMGSASAGPLMVVVAGEGGRLSAKFVDLYSLKPIEPKRGRNIAADLGQPAPIRVSASGHLFAVSGQPARLITVFGTSLSEETRFGFNAVLPDATGKTIFTDKGICDPKLELVGAASQTQPAIPATIGPFYLTIGVSLPSDEAEPAGTVSLHTLPDGHRIATFGDLSVATNPSSFSSGHLRLDQRLVLHPPSGTIVALDPANDKLHIKRFATSELLDATGANYLLVTSQPSPVAQVGKVYRYQMEVLAKGGDLEYQLLLKPNGMEISSSGLVTWHVPERWADGQQVTVRVRQPVGGSYTHAFGIQVRDEIELTASEVAASSPTPPPTAMAATTPATKLAEAPREPELPGTSSAADVTSASPSKYLDPAIFGFKIPPGEVTLPEKQSVTTIDENGEGVVAQLYADVGENRIVMLPNGTLVARTRDESPLTERRFRPATRKDITDQLETRFPHFATQATRHFNYVYNTSPNFFTGTSRILETLLPGLRKFAEAQGIKTHDPDVPLVVIMFHTQQQFSLYSKMPAGTLAYYDPLTNEIVMHEESPFLKRDAELAFKDTIATIAHEGAHQILHNIGVQKRLSMWPQWISEGIAEYLSPTSFGKNLRWKGPGATHDMRMLELELYFKSRGLETTDETMIKYTVAAYRLSSSGYASAWAITHYLANKEQAAFAAHLREVSQRKPFESPDDVVESGLLRQNLQLFQKHFGDDLAGLEKKLIEHLKTLPYDDPYAELPHFAAMIEWAVDGKPKREANVFHLQSMARKWLEDKREVLSTEGVRTATVAVRDYANRPIAEREVRRFLGR